MFNPKNMSDIELETKIFELNKKLDCSYSTEIYNQIQNYLDQLYEEQDERIILQAISESKDGIIYDSEEDYNEKLKGNNKDSKKVKEKAKSFLDNAPEIKIKWNDKK